MKVDLDLKKLSKDFDYCFLTTSISEEEEQKELISFLLGSKLLLVKLKDEKSILVLNYQNKQEFRETLELVKSRLKIDKLEFFTKGEEDSRLEKEVEEVKDFYFVLPLIERTNFSNKVDEILKELREEKEVASN